MTTFLSGVVLSIASDRNLKLSAPPELVESGLLKFILPRFSLKHSIRVELVDDKAAASVHLNSLENGRLVFSGLKSNWYLEIDQGEATQAIEKFTDFNF